MDSIEETGKSAAAEDDVMEDMELDDETADRVAGGSVVKLPPGPPC